MPAHSYASPGLSVTFAWPLCTHFNSGHEKTTVRSQGKTEKGKRQEGEREFGQQKANLNVQDEAGSSKHHFSEVPASTHTLMAVVRLFQVEYNQVLFKNTEHGLKY